MSVIAVGSVHGSPGATSLALDLARAWPDDVLLIEADPDGGSLAARLDLALKPGLMDLAGAARTAIEADELWKFAQPSSAGVGIVVAHPAAEQTSAALRAAIGRIASAARMLDGIVVIDIGRLRPGSVALGAATAADHTVIVSDNSVEAIVSLTHRAQLLGACSAPVVVLNAARPYAVAEVAVATKQTVWGVVPNGLARRDQRQRSMGIDGLLDTFRSAPISPLLTDDLVVTG